MAELVRAQNREKAKHHALDLTDTAPDMPKKHNQQSDDEYTMGYLTRYADALERR